MVYVSSDFDQPCKTRHDFKASLQDKLTVLDEQENGLFVSSNIYVSFYSEDGISLEL